LRHAVELTVADWAWSEVRAAAILARAGRAVAEVNAFEESPDIKGEGGR
jgi:hypothetical protein